MSVHPVRAHARRGSRGVAAHTRNQARAKMRRTTAADVLDPTTGRVMAYHRSLTEALKTAKGYAKQFGHDFHIDTGEYLIIVRRFPPSEVVRVFR